MLEISIAQRRDLRAQAHGLNPVVTISQNAVGNAITELLGIVVKRVEDELAYAAAEPALVAPSLAADERS